MSQKRNLKDINQLASSIVRAATEGYSLYQSQKIHPKRAFTKGKKRKQK